MPCHIQVLFCFFLSFDFSGLFDFTLTSVFLFLYQPEDIKRFFIKGIRLWRTTYTWLTLCRHTYSHNELQNSKWVNTKCFWVPKWRGEGVFVCSGFYSLQFLLDELKLHFSVLFRYSVCVCLCVTPYRADGCSSLSHFCSIIRVSGLNRSGVGKGGDNAHFLSHTHVPTHKTHISCPQPL